MVLLEAAAMAGLPALLPLVADEGTTATVTGKMANTSSDLQTHVPRRTFSVKLAMV